MKRTSKTCSVLPPTSTFHSFHHEIKRFQRPLRHCTGFLSPPPTFTSWSVRLPTAHLRVDWPSVNAPGPPVAGVPQTGSRTREWAAGEKEHSTRETSLEGSAWKAQKKGVGNIPLSSWRPFIVGLGEFRQGRLTHSGCVPNRSQGVTGHITPPSSLPYRTPDEQHVWERAEHAHVSLCSTCICRRESLCLFV